MVRMGAVLSAWICWIAPNTAAMAVSTISHSSTRMRPEERWSESSFRKTTPTPRQGDPSRRIAHSMGLEITGVDRFEARLLDGKVPQLSPRDDHRGRRFGAHVALGEEAEAVG